MEINSQTSDEDIVLYIREKNKEFFSYIIDRYKEKLRIYLNRITNYSPEVDDLVQQTLVNAYINLNNFDVKRKFSSWIYRIAHNLAINWLKKKKASISIDEDEVIANKLSDKIDIFKEMVGLEMSSHLTVAINKLPEKFKEPFILRYFEDKSYEEISSIIRKPKNTVGTMINRAKKFLKKDLKIYEQVN